MFPALTKLLNRETCSVGGKAPKLLLAIDANRALPVLLSAEFFTLENRQVHYIILAMNVAEHKIPHESLLPFLNAVRPISDKYPHDCDYAQALMAYARNPDANAEDTFRA